MQRIVDVLASAERHAADVIQQRPDDQQRSCFSANSTCATITGNNSDSAFAGAATTRLPIQSSFRTGTI